MTEFNDAYFDKLREAAFEKAKEGGWVTVAAERNLISTLTDIEDSREQHRTGNITGPRGRVSTPLDFLE